EDRCVAALPHDRLIRDDNGRTWLDRVVHLVRKLRTDSETSCDLLGRHASANTRDGHPPARGAAGSERAFPFGRTFEQRKDMVAERSASVDFHRGASDGVAITIDVERAISGTNDDRDRSARAA